MRFSFIVALAAFSSTVLAQGLLDQIPKCAQTCFGNNLGTCGFADIGCICGNKEVINTVSCCVFATCSEDDKKKTIDFAVNLCKLNNIDVDTTPDCPSNGTASASSGSVSSTPSATGSTGSQSTTSMGSQSPTAAGASSTGASAPFQTAGAGFGLGMAVAGLIAFL
ncbi:Nn.00g098490.m01.CDS01 [Neocucurbitaria sp. VM-36]